MQVKRVDLIYFAFKSLWTNRLRSTITISIIALGIMSLIGIITAMAAMEQKLTESFSTMGASGFSIRFKERRLQLTPEGRSVSITKKEKSRRRSATADPFISELEAVEFKKYYSYPAQISISSSSGNRNLVSFHNRKTTPTVSLIGTDANYLKMNDLQVSVGRNFSRQEVEYGTKACILGADVARKLFPQSNGMNQIVLINNQPFIVIGILESRGNSFGFSRDNIAIVSYKNLSAANKLRSYTIGVKTNGIQEVPEAIGEAEGLFRGIRKLKPGQNNNFTIERSNSITEKALKSLRYISLAVSVIGIITLIGAAVGLMNILLVAVAERTKEIGLIKAIGGKNINIRQQLLAESIIISIMGALLGVILGVLVGNIFAVVLHTRFVIPWLWLFYGIIICSVVGLVAGFYPAFKAGRLNPIAALRYE